MINYFCEKEWTFPKKTLNAIIAGFGVGLASAITLMPIYMDTVFLPPVEIE